MAHTGPRTIVALDYADPHSAHALVRQLDPAWCRLKVGNELFTRGGPALVGEWTESGFDVFLDLKYHDIPNTVGAACRAAADIGVWMVNAHALGGRRMLQAARDALDDAGHRPLLVAVTVLTSLDSRDLAEVGFDPDPGRLASRLAVLAHDAGCDGVVCSAREAGMLRAAHGPEFVLVTPGIRPSGSDAGDQRRTLGPREAAEAGADYLVVGRPVTGADDPAAAVRAIAGEVTGGSEV